MSKHLSLTQSYQKMHASLTSSQVASMILTIKGNLHIIGYS